MNTSSLTDQLMTQLRGAPLGQLSRQLGTSEPETESALGAALPLLLGALGRNASQPQGAEALFDALQRDHTGSDLGSVLGSVLGGGGAAGGRALDGGSILGHIFGGNRPTAEAGLGQATGLGGSQAGRLLSMLAPIVLSFLANRMSRQGLDAGGLGQELGMERQRVKEQGSLGGLGALLDQDGDGQLGIGDLMKIGGGLLGGRR
ncbi:MAG: DUF937 domain-containing protein [Caldimonas sp.]